MSFSCILNRIESAESRSAWIWVCVVQGLVFFPISGFRLIDGDEGYYLLASRLVLEGQIPYVDFFYPQMPLLPYVYGVWMKIWGISWYAARMLSALCAVLTGCLVFNHTVTVFGKRTLGVLAVLMYDFSCLTIGWYTVVKTYSLSVFLLFCAYAVLYRNSGLKKYFFSGVLLGLAIDTRLLFLGLVPAFVAGIFHLKQDGFRPYAWFASGLAIGLLPNVVFVLVQPAAYFFNNIGYHTIRSSHGLVGGFTQKVAIVFKLAGMLSAKGSAGFQMALLFLFNLCAFSVYFRNPPVSFYIAILLACASFLPTPTSVQYFSTVLPFLVINSIYFVDRIDRQSSDNAVLRESLKRMVVIVLCAYVAVSFLDIYRYTEWGMDVPGVESRRNVTNWRVQTVNQIASEIDQHAGRGEFVLTWWPGYLVESHASILPKMENHFGLDVAAAVDSSRRETFNIVSEEEIRQHLESHRIRLVVLGNWVFHKRGEYRDLLLRSGYATIRSIGDTEIYSYAPPE